MPEKSGKNFFPWLHRINDLNNSLWHISNLVNTCTLSAATVSDKNNHVLNTLYSGNLELFKQTNLFSKQIKKYTHGFL